MSRRYEESIIRMYGGNQHNRHGLWPKDRLFWLTIDITISNNTYSGSRICIRFTLEYRFSTEIYRMRISIRGLNSGTVMLINWDLLKWYFCKELAPWVCYFMSHISDRHRIVITTTAEGSTSAIVKYRNRNIGYSDHDDVIKWKHFPRYWPFVRGIHRPPVNSPHKGQWRGALMLSLICACWVNNREAGDLRRHRAHYDVTVMWSQLLQELRQDCCRHPGQF